MSRSFKTSQNKHANQLEMKQTSRANILFSQGLALHRQGQLLEAQIIYKKVLALRSKHFDALYLSGVIEVQLKNYIQALDLITKAIEINADAAQAYYIQGVALQNLKRFEVAVVSYDRAIALKQDYVEAYINRGISLQILKQFEAAVSSYDKAIEIKPDYAEAYNNRGNALKELARLEEAVASYDKAISLNKNYADAYNNRGNALLALKKLEAALASYDKAINIKVDYAEAYNNRGNVLKELSHFEAALASYEKAIAIKVDYAEAYSNRGNALKELGHLEAAVASYDNAIALKPNYANAYYNRGVLLQTLKYLDNAIASYDKAIEIKADYAEAYCNRGNALQAQGRLNEAIENIHQAILIKPNFAEAYSNLGNALRDQGRLDEAVDHYRRALLINPNYEDAFGNLLFTLNYHPYKSAEEIFTYYKEYDDRFGASYRINWREHTNKRETKRRLKVGYVSSDFRAHPVRYFLEPLLASHDKDVVEVYAYAEVLRDDTITLRYKKYVEHWIPTIGLTDEELSDRIRADEIDILIDLAGHTAGNRLGVFARKPAPVSVTWLGICGTTGLKAINYFLTDEFSAPQGSEILYSEIPWRLDASSYVYRPAEGMGEVSPLPAETRGYVTFGSLTRAVRINPRLIEIWAEILKQVPDAKLAINSKDFQDTSMQSLLIERFGAYDIKSERLEIGCHSPPWNVLRGIDIGLDCFPSNSVTTLFENLNMGIPFVTLAGRPSVGRIGSAILQGIGRQEWIAYSEAEYIDKAVHLARDFVALARIRAELRNELKASPLMDEYGFARKVEEAYRAMFAKWSSGQL